MKRFAQKIEKRILDRSDILQLWVLMSGFIKVITNTLSYGLDCSTLSEYVNHCMHRFIVTRMPLVTSISFKPPNLRFRPQNWIKTHYSFSVAQKGFGRLDLTLF